MGADLGETMLGQDDEMPVDMHMGDVREVTPPTQQVPVPSALALCIAAASRPEALPSLHPVNSSFPWTPGQAHFLRGAFQGSGLASWVDFHQPLSPFLPAMALN